MLTVTTACDPAPADGPPPTVRLVVLVVDDGSEMVAAIADRLGQEGVRTERLDLSAPSRPTITPAYLGEVSPTTATANFAGVVVPSEATPGLSEGERSVLADYERGFGVREVVASTWANPAVGLNYAASPGYVGPVDGFEATLTPAAGDFSYLDGRVTLDDLDPAVDESWGYLATPLANDPAGTFTPLLTATIPGTDIPGSLFGVYETDRREQLISTFASNGSQEHFKVLAHGLVSWLTKGVSTSLYRNRFSVQVDDVFLPDDRWSIDGNCTIGDGCDPVAYPPDAPGASIRMGPDDVAAAAAWQEANGFTLDFAYNAGGIWEAGPFDPLTSALVAERTRFRWTNHTWSHPYLGCVQDDSVSPWRCATVDGETQWVPGATISNEIDLNRGYGFGLGLPLDGSELVTGEHSGLRSLPQMPVDNPELAPALAASGVAWIASDASREPDTRTVGQARTVPRHPMNIFYNTATKAEAADEYNWIYTRRADGGSGTCEDHPETTTCIDPLDLSTGFDQYIVPIERRIAFGHVVGMSPRPHYAHQSNLTEDRILYPVLTGVLDRYRATFADDTPVLNDRLSEVGAEMERRRAWSEATAVVATVTGRDLVVQNPGPDPATVPLTVPEGTLDTPGGEPTGTPYAGRRSTWVTVPAGGSVTVQLPADDVFRSPASWPRPAPAPVPPPTPPAVVEGPTTEVVELPEARTELIEPQQTAGGPTAPASIGPGPSPRTGARS